MPLHRSEPVAVGADNLALGHLGQDLHPRTTIGNQGGDARDFLAADVIPVEAASPSCPTTVHAGSTQLDRIVDVLTFESPPPGRRQVVPRSPLAHPLRSRTLSMASSTSWNALGQFSPNALCRCAQLDHSRNVPNLSFTVEVVRIDRVDAVVATVDAASPLPVVHNVLQPPAGALQIDRADPLAPLSSPDTAARPIVWIGPASLVPGCGLPPFLGCLTLCRLSFTADRR
jgi:hypothetical protein